MRCVVFLSFSPEGGSAAEGLEFCLRGTSHADGVSLDPGVAPLASERGSWEVTRRNRVRARRGSGTLFVTASRDKPGLHTRRSVGISFARRETTPTLGQARRATADYERSLCPQRGGHEMLRRNQAGSPNQRLPQQNPTICRC